MKCLDHGTQDRKHKGLAVFLCLTTSLVVAQLVLYQIAFDHLSLAEQLKEKQTNYIGTRQKEQIVLPLSSASTLTNVNQPLEKLKKARQIGPKQDVHFVFSTSCNSYQDWQAKLLHWSARQIAGQKGKITRIISGCDGYNSSDYNEADAVQNHLPGFGDENIKKEQIHRYPVEDDEFYVHFTPTFPKSKEFPWINKPMGIAHWVRHSSVTESIIVILGKLYHWKVLLLYMLNANQPRKDPDMLLLQPTYSKDHPTRWFKHNEVLCSTSCKNRHMKTKLQKEEMKRFTDGVNDYVREGFPVAQTYDLRSKWIENMDVETVVGKNSRSSRIAPVHVRHFYSIGPPYFMHINDMRRLIPLWENFMSGCRKALPKDILADMYAFSLAAIELDLPHRSFDHYMISNVKSNVEGWKWIDTLLGNSNDVVSESPLCSKAYRISGGAKNYVSLLHYAQYYKLDSRSREHRASTKDKDLLWFFHKAYVPPNIFSCEVPLLTPPPEDLIQRQNTTLAKRSSFCICTLIHSLNQAVLAWRKKHCSGSYNSDHRIRLDYLKNCQGPEAGKSCFPGARLIKDE